jgi:hypothetical protein
MSQQFEFLPNDGLVPDIRSYHRRVNFSIVALPGMRRHMDHFSGRGKQPWPSLRRHFRQVVSLFFLLASTIE